MAGSPRKLPPHPRLSILLASEAPIAVVFRRGPTKLVRLFVWNRQRDEFEDGSIFKGRIHTDVSDISPDGRFLIYFAAGGRIWAIPETGGTWTAISQLPSLTAIALWGQGDCRGGGGMFTSNTSFWLDADGNTFLIRDDSGLRRETLRPHQSQLERAGWISIRDEAGGAVSEKVLPGGWLLRKIQRYFKPDRYELERLEGGVLKAGVVKDRHILTFLAWEWVD